MIEVRQENIFPAIFLPCFQALFPGSWQETQEFHVFFKIPFFWIRALGVRSLHCLPRRTGSPTHACFSRVAGCWRAVGAESNVGKVHLYISATSIKNVAKNLPKTYFYARCDEYAVERRIAGLPVDAIAVLRALCVLCG